MPDPDKAKRTLLAVEIPRDELACRIIEALLSVKRPRGLSPADAMRALETANPETVLKCRAAADAAVFYFYECLQAARRPS